MSSWVLTIIFEDGEVQTYGPFSEPEYAEAFYNLEDNENVKEWYVTSLENAI